MSIPPKLFISYAHKDAKWFNELKTHLTPLADNALVDAWEDTRIPVGANWEGEIVQALNAADIAVLLVSPEFLKSRYIQNKELPELLKKKKIIWISVSACSYEVTKLQPLQAANDPNKPIDLLSRARRNVVWKDICRKILEAAENPL